MDMTTQPGFLTSSCHNIYPVTTGLSEKAKAFTIDALLSTDKGNKEPVIRRKLPFHTTSLDCEPTLPSGRSYEYENNSISGKEQNAEFSSLHGIVSYEKFIPGPMTENMKCTTKQKSYVPSKNTTDNPQHLIFNSPTSLEGSIYSPLMTSGFFRPVESYSPLSYEGTPAGLKTFNHSVQRSFNYCSNTSNLAKTSPNGYSTPEHGMPINGGSKILSTRKTVRSHPYLSTKHTMNSDKSDTDKVIQGLTNSELKCRTEKGKRHRTAFTQEQLQCLEAEFEKQQYLVGEERIQLAESLNLKVSHVKVWFQNRRIKWRKEQFGQ